MGETEGGPGQSRTGAGGSAGSPQERGAQETSRGEQATCREPTSKVLQPLVVL